jgi:predicted aspartyl protease
MAVVFRYDKDVSPILGKIYRPIAQVFFFSQNKGRWYEAWMIVDTGADYTLLPRYFSKRLGINLEKDCKIFKTSGIGGEEKVYFLKSIKVKLGNWRRDIPIGFLDRDDIPPLMGRHQFLETFEALFSSNHRVTFSTK